MKPQRSAISLRKHRCTGAQSPAFTCTCPSLQSNRSVPDAVRAKAKVSAPVNRTPSDSSQADCRASFNALVAVARSCRSPRNGAFGLFAPSELGGGTASSTATHRSSTDATSCCAASTYADASRAAPVVPPSSPSHLSLWHRTSSSPKENTQNESLCCWLFAAVFPSRRAGGRRSRVKFGSCRCFATAHEKMVPPQNWVRTHPVARARARPPWQSPTTSTASRNGAAAASKADVLPISFAWFIARWERRLRCFQPAQCATACVWSCSCMLHTVHWALS